MGKWYKRIETVGALLAVIAAMCSAMYFGLELARELKLLEEQEDYEEY